MTFRQSSSKSFVNKIAQFGMLAIVVVIGAGAGLYFASQPEGGVDSNAAQREDVEGFQDTTSLLEKKIDSDENSSYSGDNSINVGGGLIKDETIGVEFTVPEDLTRVTGRRELYSFEVIDVPQINCFLDSRTVDKSIKEEETIDYEVRKLMEELSGAYDDISESGKRAFNLGDGIGVRFTVNLGRKDESVKRIDQFGVVPGRVVHMKCEAPPSLYKVFERKFEAMLSSLRMTR